MALIWLEQCWWVGALPHSSFLRFQWSNLEKDCTLVSGPFLSHNTSLNAHSSRALFKSSSIYSLKGSKFCVKVFLPYRVFLQTGMDLAEWIWWQAIFFPSTRICPLKDLRIRNSDIIMVHLPLPILPTIPILSPAGKVTESRRSAGSKFGLYLMKKSMNLISPQSGHSPTNRDLRCCLRSLLLILSSSRYSTYPGSGLRCINEEHLSKEINSFSKLLRFIVSELVETQRHS
jgi:hypothetical protein